MWTAGGRANAGFLACLPRIGEGKETRFLDLLDKVRPALLLAFVSFSRLNLTTESRSKGDPGVFELSFMPRPFYSHKSPLARGLQFVSKREKPMKG